MRDALESVERQTGVRPSDLDGPDMPPDGAHVWVWFLALCEGRSSSGFGPNPISYLDILAWSLLTGTIVRPSEVAAIMALDREYFVAQASNEGS